MGTLRGGVDCEITLPPGSAVWTAAGRADAEMHTFNTRPLLGPPNLGVGKFEQRLGWLKDHGVEPCASTSST